MKHKLLIITVLMPIFMYSQGGFYDFNTEQFGIYARQVVNITFQTQVLAGLRHQKHITTAEVLLGGEIGKELSIGGYIGIGWNFSQFQDAKPSGTAIISVNQEITRKLIFTIHYQPTLNNNLFPVLWQHQAGMGLRFKL